MALRLSEVGYVYSAGTPYSQTALEGVSLSLEKGALLVVLGSTGSGKSTLLRVAAGLTTPSAGRVELDGEVLAGSPPVGTVGMVFQNPEAQLFEETVLKDVAFGPRNMGLSEEEAQSAALGALERVGLAPDRFAKRSPFALSGGEARRVAIAGVLAMSPSYLLLDEPTAGLDGGGRESLLEIVRSATVSSGVMVVTHDPEVFLTDADQVLVLKEGSDAFSGTAGELLAAPDVLESAGLESPPLALVQSFAMGRGLSLPGVTLDPFVAAERLADAGGWTS